MRSPPMRLRVIHRKLGVLQHVFLALRLAVGEREPDRGGEQDLAVVEGDRRAQRLADRVGERRDARRLALGEDQQAELVAAEPRQRVLRLQQPAEPARQRQQDRVADRHADRVVHLLEAVEIDHHHGRADGGVGRGEGQRRIEPVEVQFAVRQAGEIVVHGIVQQPLLGGLELGHVGQRADEAHHLAVGGDHGPRLQGEPHVMAVERAQAEFEEQPAAALIEHAVERGAEAVAVERMQQLEPVGRRAAERAALEAEQRLGLGRGEHAVVRNVPVPDHVARRRSARARAARCRRRSRWRRRPRRRAASR